jgi:hypothetical protein
LIKFFLKLIAQAAWLRTCNSTPVASLKKFPSDFFNHSFSMTEPTDVPYASTGVKCECLKSIKAKFIFKIYALIKAQFIFFI